MVNINNVKSGDIVSHAINSGNRVLVAEGTVINNRLIEKLRNWNIFDINVDNQIKTKKNIYYGMLDNSIYPKTNYGMFFNDNTYNFLKEELGNQELQGKILARKLANDFRSVIKTPSYQNIISGIESIISKKHNNKIDFNQETFNDNLINNIRESFLDNYPYVLTYAETIRQLQGDLTYPHAYKVAVYSYIVAKAMNIDNNIKKDDKYYQNIIKAAFLHDVGKLRPDIQELIYEPKKLNYKEKEVVKKHVKYGLELLLSNKDFNIDKSVLLAIAQHHEKYNGSGYPHGSCGNKISEMSAIIATADQYEALTSPKQYRKAYTNKETFQNLIKNVYGNSDYFNGSLLSLKRNEEIKNDNFFGPISTLGKILNNKKENNYFNKIN